MLRACPPWGEKVHTGWDQLPAPEPSAHPQRAEPPFATLSLRGARPGHLRAQQFGGRRGAAAGLWVSRDRAPHSVNKRPCFSKGVC